ncbi:MAG: TonB-dependent receptor plug domain-containing protein, partial [Ferruginibacter sp.]
MKKLLFILLLLPLVFIAGSAFSQKKQITGKVLDMATSKPLVGVSVVAGKDNAGTTTKEDGTYSISVGQNLKSIVFSFVGYGTRTVSIEGKNSIDVILVSEATTQSEVVVIGYGTQKRSNISGAVSKYKNDRIDEAPVSRLDQALQGKIAGVQIQNVTSEAGADPKITIRGVGSINAGASPLVVVDGQITPDGLAFINPSDVESIEVLKDAASAAI